MTKDNRIILISEMEDEHLVNTILFMDRRNEVLNEREAKFSTIIVKRFHNLEIEAHKRGLTPRIMLARGDTRGLVRATKELHSKPDFTPKKRDHADHD